jgi:hypothetical protein
MGCAASRWVATNKVLYHPDLAEFVKVPRALYHFTWAFIFFSRYMERRLDILMHLLAYGVNIESEWSYKLQRLPLEAHRVMREKGAAEALRGQGNVKKTRLSIYQPLHFL